MDYLIGFGGHTPHGCPYLGPQRPVPLSVLSTRGVAACTWDAFLMMADYLLAVYDCEELDCWMRALYSQAPATNDTAVDVSPVSGS